ncbi:MAG: histidine phosphatase family protein [Chloroflexi bacterium]|nr:histidine phosphatase family protein [Chloroflexota bacterium]
MDNISSNIHHITLLRHGQSVGNAEGYHQGQVEFPLTDHGRAQSLALAQYWQSKGTIFDNAIASPQSRAKETAQIIAGHLDLSLSFDPIWMERDNGALGGRHHSEVTELNDQRIFRSPYDPVGETGESQWELYLRAGRALQSLINQPPSRYLVISHGGLLNLVMYAVLGINPQAFYHGPRFRFQNSAFTMLSYYPSRHQWVVHVTNHHPHLDDSEIYL